MARRCREYTSCFGEVLELLVRANLPGFLHLAWNVKKSRFFFEVGVSAIRVHVVSFFYALHLVFSSNIREN